MHNVLTDSFLAAHRAFGAVALMPTDADRFVWEQARIGRMLGAEPVPEAADPLSRWVADHGDLAPSPGMRATVDFLADPPLERVQKVGYRLLYLGAVSTIPGRIRDLLGIRLRRDARPVGALAVRLLRSALGSSPSWNLALIRAGCPVPEGVFRQPLPVDIPPGWRPPDH